MENLRFLSDWSHEKNGDIRPEESLSIEYASERLPRCRNRRYGSDVCWPQAYGWHRFTAVQHRRKMTSRKGRKQGA
jgi:hypothetical protein